MCRFLGWEAFKFYINLQFLPSWSTMQAPNNNRVAAITDPEYTCRYAQPFAPAAAPTNLRLPPSVGDEHVPHA